ncbi:MAG: N-acetylglucosamine-6-phosphate deacetylase [Micrococcus sp.]|nr:N-acetylglucosamine-6-phosphate deacetylase [Micrococcus sp.]
MSLPTPDDTAAVSHGTAPRLLRAPRAVTGDGTLENAWLVIEEGLIAELGEGAPPARLQALDVVEIHDRTGAGAWLTPGFVDIHCHGGGGAAFTEGADAGRQAVAAHRAHGTSAMLASLVTDRVDRLVAQVHALVPLVQDGTVLGLHLEGPWLSARHCGAHPAELLGPPQPDDVDALLAAAQGTLAMVTLAPELPGALEATRRLVAAGVRVAIGHTDATYDQTRAAIDAGATVATHLFNAARAPHHREPGPSLALLQDPRVAVESIVDGLHLHPAVVAETASRVGERWVLVTDAMAAAAAPDGAYVLGTLPVTVARGTATVTGTSALAGSTLTMDRAVRAAIAAGVDLDAAVRAATAAPARALGWQDRGVLRPGARADFCVVDHSGTLLHQWYGEAGTAARM